MDHPQERATPPVDLEKNHDSASVTSKSSSPASSLSPAAPPRRPWAIAAYFARGAGANDTGPPPDGGLRAWLQILMGHLIVANVWGYINSFGLFQSYYSQTLGRPPADISWVGSLQIFLVFLIGSVSGRATDAGYYRLILLSGSILVLIGIFTSAQSTQYWHLLLSQGICQGLGNGLLFCPTVSLVVTYFSRRRALAISLIASGAATGGIVFPLIAQQLQHRVGFAWTVRVMGFVVAAGFLLAMILARPRIPPRASGPLIEWAAFREPAFCLFAAAMFCNLWAVYFAYYFIPSFARSVIKVDSSTSISILLLMNGIGLPGRVIPALISDRFLSPLSTLLPVAIACSVLLYSWTAIHSLPGLYAFAAVYGFFGAGIQGLFPAACSSLTKDLGKMGTRIGMLFSIVSVASLTGPPIAGALIQRAGGRYIGAQMFGGSAFALGSALLAAAWAMKRRGEKREGENGIATAGAADT